MCAAKAMDTQQREPDVIPEAVKATALFTCAVCPSPGPVLPAAEGWTDMKTTDNGNQYNPTRLPFNGQPLRKDEVLVPQFISRDYADLIGATDVRTWYMCGVPYLVMFIAVPAEQAEIALKAFNADVNDYLDERLGPNRRSRCLIPQPDGSVRPCPKETKGRYNPCAGCPHRGELEKEDRNPISLDALDGDGFQLADAVPSAESSAMLGFLLADLLDEFSDKCPRYAEIVRLGYDGLDKKEILQQLPMKKSQAYQTYNDCRKATEDFLKN